jgi:dTMP kinase
MTTSTGGALVSIDGPGGVGKTTTIEHLTAILRRAGLRVHRTAQPSAGPIGALACDLVPTAGGAALACLFAADRYHQLDTEIRPHRDDGEIVLCDRYLASGLVVQRADGLDLAFLAAINQRTDPPDLAVVLTADPNTIAKRLAERGVHNRYQGSPTLAAAELTHYRDAATHLQRLGVCVLFVDTTHLPPDRVAVRVAAAIPDLCRAAPATTGRTA